MIIGTNWIFGWSHTSAAAGAMILKCNHSAEVIADMLEVYLKAGVDTIMGLFSAGNSFGESPRAPMLLEAMRMAEERAGRKLIVVDTPTLNMDDSTAGRKEAEAKIAECKRNGATFCLVHHSSAEQLVNKNKGTLDRLPDYTKMIRDHGMIPGLSAHMPELIIYSDQQGYDVETYVQIFNCMGFLMQVEIEYIHKVIWNAKKPVMTIKPMAAGRCTPFVGLNFVWNTIRPQDMVTVGCISAEEAAEDIEFSLAALERRAPNVAGRSSPNKKTAVLSE